MAEEAMNGLTLAPTRPSIAELEASVTPSLQLYENVINNVDDPYWKMVANDAKRDLYTGMVVRQRNSIDGVNMPARNKLEPKIAPWRDVAAGANAAVADTARAHPDIAQRDPTIAAISGRSKGESPPTVATRK